MHDECALLDVGADAQEGEEPDPALDWTLALHEGNLNRNIVVVFYYVFIIEDGAKSLLSSAGMFKRATRCYVTRVMLKY